MQADGIRGGVALSDIQEGGELLNCRVGPHVGGFLTKTSV
jgi:hypothetical protein